MSILNWINTRHKLSEKTGLSLILGTYIAVKIDLFLKSRSFANKTDIDDLILFEQRVNLMNAPGTNCIKIGLPEKLILC